MSNQILKDAKGYKIGEIKESNGKLEIFDSKGYKKGEYDPKSNTTKNNLGYKVGNGNLLTTLL